MRSDLPQAALGTITGETVARVGSGIEDADGRDARDLDCDADDVVGEEADFGAADVALAPDVKSVVGFVRDRVQDVVCRERKSRQVFKVGPLLRPGSTATCRTKRSRTLRRSRR
jgi:hypothetical protein